jgi:rod shape-determining protein MreD
MTLNIRLVFLLLVAVVLTIIPLPAMMVNARPAWVLILVLYIQLYFPNYFHPTLLFFIGLCLDVLLSTVIGEHAFALLFTTWLASGKTRRFGFFSMIQQMIWVGWFCLIYQLILYLIEAFLGYHPNLGMLLGTVAFTLLLWPWMARALDQRTFVAHRHL